MGRYRLLGIMLASVLCLNAHARPLSPEHVPEPLQPWVDWVLHGEEQRLCPFIYKQSGEPQCAWPSRLHLDATDTGARFEQDWRVYKASWLILAGDTRHWPQSVLLNDRPATVIARDGQPAVWAETGNWRISGELAWRKPPEYIQIPARTGLTRLSLNGEDVRAPDLDAQGRLWLGKKAGAEQTEQGDKLALSVFRKIVDDIPLRSVTRVRLRVTGSQREQVIGTALLAGAIPLALSSPLPARIEADGALRVQLRPGEWDITLEARHSGEIFSLQAPPPSADWVDYEIWSFEAIPGLRLVELTDVTRIDPRQTEMPQEWRSLPGFRVRGGEKVGFKQIRRGDPEPEPDRLTLKRVLWLDFDGGGYTANDRIEGIMTRDWRLEAREGWDLGRVAIDGRTQFITHRADSERRGVEVRRGQLRLDADVRYNVARDRLPATGWQHDFDRAEAMLWLPPGWKLFAASGADDIADTWVKRWTLLDLFLVLILALSVARLWNWKLGALALVTLTLIWHEAGAPRFVWISLMIAIALLRVLPAGWPRRLVGGYRNISLLALLLIGLPFAVAQVRVGLYPQLEFGAYNPMMKAPGFEAGISSDAMQEEMESAPAEKDTPRKLMARQLAQSVTPPAAPGLAATIRLNEVDPTAVLQTGPGLPDWSWRGIRINWNGPVESSRELHLWLMPPAFNTLLNFLRVALLFVLALPMLGVSRFSPRAWLAAGGGGGVNVLLMGSLLGGLLLASPPGVSAAPTGFPEQALLDDLKHRLLAAPECVPDCARIPTMQLEVDDAGLRLQLEVHAAARVAVPLPGNAAHWLAESVTLETGAATLYRHESTLWVALEPGRHLVSARGGLYADQVQIDLPLPPARIGIKARGWQVAGVHEDGALDKQLSLKRERRREQALPTLKPSTLPPFARVERRLVLDIDWLVETRVTRASPGADAAILEIPLLPGEAPLDEDLRVRDGRVLVSLGAGQHSFVWRSRLEKAASLELVAATTDKWVEQWIVEISPIWHLETSGIAVVHHQDRRGHWSPQWRPWPGEKVSLEISRPEGMEGPSLTIDTSDLHVRPGERAVDVELMLVLRSSRGGRHTLTLPEGAQLQNVSVNGLTQPIRQDGRRINLPVNPGKSEFQLSWRQSDGMRGWFQVPRTDLGVASGNARIQLDVGHNRWILFAGGPRLGPAVLYWGVLLVVLLAALVLGRIRWTPLKTHHWMLLGIGLSPVSPGMALLVVGWLLALAWRERRAEIQSNAWFNVTQLGLLLFSLVALGTLLLAVQQGLLGAPEMHIAGNNSSAYQLHWYQDRAEALLPSAWLVSLPMFVYRVLMLLWALWLAFALLGWLRWGWQCFSHGGLWRKTPRKPREGSAARGEQP